MIWGELRRAHPTKSGHFDPAHFDGSNKLWASLEVSLCVRVINERLSFVICQFIMGAEQWTQEIAFLEL